MDRLQANRWIVLLAAMAAFLPIVVDLTILHIAVPSLTIALEASATEVLWILDIYPLLMASLLVPMGTLGDRVGHRPLLGYGLLIFMLASVAAAFSTSTTMLIASRGVMAVGSSMVMPSILAIIRVTFQDDRERALALGLWGTVASAGAAVGPLIGGVLLEHFWWGSVFLVNVPIVLLVGPAVVMLARPSTRAPGIGRWPVGQALTLIAGLMLSVYALKSFAKPDMPFVGAAGLLLAGMLAIAAFVHVQRIASEPMLDLSLFRKPEIRAGVLMGLVVMGALAGVELTLAQELQFVVGKTPLQAGVFMLPLMIASAIGGPLGGWLVGLAGLRSVSFGSLVASAASMAGLAVMHLDQPNGGLVLLLATLGLSLSVGLTASSVAIMGSVAAEQAGSAGGLEATSYDLGTGLGITGFGVLLAGMYARAFDMPSNLREELDAEATASIGDTMLAASRLDGTSGEVLVAAGKLAFVHAHQSVLLISALLIGVLALLVPLILSKTDDV